MTQHTSNANAVRVIKRTAAPASVAHLQKWLSRLLQPVPVSASSGDLQEVLASARASQVEIGHRVTVLDLPETCITITLGRRRWELDTSQAASLRLLLVATSGNEADTIAIASALARAIRGCETLLERIHQEQRLMAAPAGYTGKGGLH